MNNLFIGFLYRDADQKWLLRNSKKGLQVAANNFQWNFIKGLEENLNSSIDIISSLSLGSYPLSSKKLVVKNQNSTTGINETFIQLGFLNFYLIKGFCRFIFLIQSLRTWIKKNPQGGTIYVYSLYTPYLLALKFLKKTLVQNKIKYCLILPDLPGKYGMLQPWYTFTGFYRRIDSFFLIQLSQYADCYVCLTKYMTTPMNIRNKPFAVIEGIISTSQILLYNKKEVGKEKSNNTKIILYTGSLLNDFGIEKLLQAFQAIEEENYELWFCGPNEESETVLKYASKDTRIKYLGFLQKDAIVRLQKMATVLINPRPNIGEYVKYSFPSKTMEYLLSGTPLIMYRLEGVPEDYNNYIYFLKEYSVDNIKETIIEVCKKSKKELENFGANAKSFVTNNKNSAIQTRVILNIVEKL